MNSTLKVVGILLVLVVVLGGLVFFAQPPVPPEVACTMEAKICPDGSSVGRQGPSCEFTACPDVPNEPGWETVVDSAQQVSFQYPPTLGLTYVNTVDWPPVASVQDEYSCVAGGDIPASGGLTEEKKSGTQERYCATIRSEGAAGSVYSMYAYEFPRGGQSVILTFALREVQCMNYDSPNKETCIAEQATFNPDALAERMARTLTLGQ